MDPAITSDPSKMASLGKKHANLKDLIAKILELEKNQETIAQSRDLLAQENDAEMREMAQTELAEAERRAAVLQDQIDEELHPADPNDKKMSLWKSEPAPAVMNPRCLPANFSDVFPLCRTPRLEMEILKPVKMNFGGFKEVVFGVKGKDVLAI